MIRELGDFTLERQLGSGATAQVQTVLSLKHPNIVQVLEPLLELDPPAVALEYIDGVSLEEFQTRLPYVLPEISALILIEVLSALEQAHARGVTSQSDLFSAAGLA